MSDVRYVMILEIEKIVKKTTAGSWNSTTRTNESVESRTKHDVFKVIINDTDLNRLLDRGTKHLALVQDEETEE